MNSKQCMKFLFLVGMFISSQPLFAKIPTTTRNHLADSASLMLQTDYKIAYRHLDEIAGTLQYLGQVINKGSLKIVNKPLVQRWILDHLILIKNLRQAEEASNEKALLNLTKITQSLNIHVINTVAGVFENPVQFEIPVLEDRSLPEPLTVEAQAELIQEIEAQLSENERLLAELRNQANTAGLTTKNKWARKIDAFNEKWRITYTLEKLPKFIGLAGLALFLTPKHWVDRSHVPGLPYIKSWIGSSKYIDPQGHYDIIGLPQADRPPEPNPPLKKTLGGLLQKHNEDYGVLQGLGAAAVALFADDIFGPALAPIKSKIRDWWNEQKGYDMPSRAMYRYTTITLDDPKLVGLETQIAELKKIVRYITEPESFDRSASGLERGILLTGPSRNGKTLSAMALCGTLNQVMALKDSTKKFTFRSLKGNEIKWNHEGIKGIIQEAKENAPCVLFIDELHNLPLQTKEGGETLTEFLTMADELQSTGINDAVIIIGATNQANLLDAALLKPGRFGKQIHFEGPSLDKRKRFFTTMCQQNAMDPNDFDIEALARQTAQCSFGDLDLIFKNARFAARNRQTTVRQDDFQQNIQEHVYRLRNDVQSPLSAEERKLMAVHLAGHALMYLLYERGIQETLELITLKGEWPKILETRYFDTNQESLDLRKQPPKSKYGHVITSKKSEILGLETEPVLAAKIKLAGALAEKVILGSTNYSYHETDKTKALAYLEKIEFNGLPKESYTPLELVEPMKRAKERLAQCENEVTEILIAHKSDLEKIATELEKRELLTKNDLMHLLENPGI